MMYYAKRMMSDGGVWRYFEIDEPQDLYLHWWIDVLLSTEPRMMGDGLDDGLGLRTYDGPTGWKFGHHLAMSAGALQLSSRPAPSL